MEKVTINMPLFTIDDTRGSDGSIKPGMKTMYEIAYRIKDSILQHGLMGVGKSEGVKQWNASKVKEFEERIKNGEKVKPWNPEICDVRLSLKEPVDLIGIPVISKNEQGEQVTVWATPSCWPKGDKFSGGVIHFDEINQGQPAILNAAFQLILDRCLGDYKVPDGYLIIASANPPALNPTVTELSLPLANRFSHFNVKCDFQSWLNYRLNKKGNIDVMSFLESQDKGLLFDQKTLESKISDTSGLIFNDVILTPRSWEVVERVMNLPDENHGGFSLETKRLYITGRTGSAIANRFINFIQDKNKYQSWEEILKDGKNFRTEEIDSYWVTRLNCMSNIINEEDDKICRNYVLNFLKATKSLTKDSNKTMNFVDLLRCERLSRNDALFDPQRDCPELLRMCKKVILA